MKKILFLILFSLTFSTRGMACDSCNFFEYSLLENKSYAGFFYRFRNFDSYTRYSSTKTLNLATYPLQLATELVPFLIMKFFMNPRVTGFLYKKPNKILKLTKP